MAHNVKVYDVAQALTERLGNVAEFLRGNKRPQGATDLAKTEPEPPDWAAKRIPVVRRWFGILRTNLAQPHPMCHNALSKIAIQINVLTRK